MRTTQLIYGAALASSAVARNSYKPLTWTEGALRMNHVQVVGSHNSYHIESPLEEREAQKLLIDNTINFWYSHPQLDIQLSDHQVRNLEIDVLADPDGGAYAEPLVREMSGLPYDDDPVWKQPGVKVLHIPDGDIHTLCKTLVSCLWIIKGWMDAHPQSVPLPIMMEFKTASKDAPRKNAPVIEWHDFGLLSELDDEIRSVFGRDQLLTPDDVRRGNLTLEKSILQHGWPDLESARGRIFFLMDNGPDDRVSFYYKHERPSLEGRVLFTNASPGNPDCAFQKLNEPNTDEEIANIQKQVQAGYWVRTRADVPMETVLLDNCSTVRRDSAFRSGAQIVSTDFQAYGMSSRWGCDYAAKLPLRKAAICNPVNGPEDCDDSDGLEPVSYRFGF